MAVPARHVRHVFAAHCLVLENEILENLVQRRADVHIAVGERRAVVQQKTLRALAPLLDLFVQAVRIPLGQALRLALHKAGAHRKIRLRKVQRIFILHLKLRPTGQARQPTSPLGQAK